jgi:hypothetical protein
MEESNLPYETIMFPYEAKVYQIKEPVARA